MKETIITKEDIEYIYQKMFRNGVHEIGMDLQELQGIFELLAKERSMLLDPFILVGTQLRLVRSETKRLIEVINKLDPYFRVKDNKKP